MQPACQCLFFTSSITKTAISGSLFRTLGDPFQKTLEKACFLLSIPFIFHLIFSLNIFFHDSPWLKYNGYVA